LQANDIMSRAHNEIFCLWQKVKVALGLGAGELFYFIQGARLRSLDCFAVPTLALACAMGSRAPTTDLPLASQLNVSLPQRHNQSITPQLNAKSIINRLCETQSVEAI